MDTILKVFLLLAVTTLVYTQDYCQECEDHTKCIYPGISDECHNPPRRGISDSDAQLIVDTHNSLRNKVATGQEDRGNPGPQPSASNMRKLVWDSEAADIAQRWADQCSFGHDKCRSKINMGCGQNVWMMMSSDDNAQINFADPVQGWYDEVVSFNKDNNSPFQFTEETGHYTQVVWADSLYVGCGFTQFPTTDWNNYYVVCNYCPPGNVIGTTMYETGDAASECPDGTSPDSTYPGLCS